MLASQIAVLTSPPSPMRGLSRVATQPNLAADTVLHWATHDLQIPLRFVNQLAQTLVLQFEDQVPAEVSARLRMIASATDDMNRLLLELLNLQRPGPLAEPPKEVDMAELAKITVAELAESSSSNLTFKISALPPCHGDRILLKQVFRNLISNAIKFSRSGQSPCIRVGHKSCGGTTAYYVRDNGIGFPARDHEKIFRPWHRSTNARDAEGSGIGLDVAQTIVKRHGGRIWAKSEVGKGATIFFTIPPHEKGNCA